MALREGEECPWCGSKIVSDDEDWGLLSCSNAKCGHSWDNEEENYPDLENDFGVAE